MSSLLLFPSRGEGFGLPVAESMSAGIPVIYTNWSSTPEIAEADGNIPIDFHLDEAEGMFHHGYEIGSKYAIPSIGSCMAALRTKYKEWCDDREAYYSKVVHHRGIIDEKFGYDSVSSFLEKAINDKGEIPTEIAKEVLTNDVKIGQGVGGSIRNNSNWPWSQGINVVTPGHAPSIISNPDKSVEDDGLVYNDSPSLEITQPGIHNGENTGDVEDSDETGL
jgi:hypothetical protein